MYDPEIFQRFNANFLSPQGFSGERFNQAVLDSVRTDTLIRTLTSTAFVLPQEAESRLQHLFGPVHAQVVRWDPSKLTPPEPKAEELETFYKSSVADFTIPARRTVELVEFVAAGTSEDQRSKAGEAALLLLRNFSTFPRERHAPISHPKPRKPNSRFAATDLFPPTTPLSPEKPIPN